MNKENEQHYILKGKKMNTRILVLLVLIAANVAGCRTPKGESVSEKRAYAFEMREEVMAELYEKRPEAKEKIANAAGYGVFSNVNINLLLLSSGNGYGIVRDNATGKDTHMTMRALGVGIGAGVKDFRAVIIFKNPQVMHDFVEKGWEWGGHADAAAKAGKTGAEAGVAGEIMGEMEIYNFTESGIALQATVAGTKYWKDKKLN